MSEAKWNLVPLTPEYIEDEHSGYVAELEDALENDEIRNIALSGSYGVGKSSILRELARRHKDRVVELSLSTLAATRPPESEKLDEAVPIQATTTTNRIQQEIVKQLLYRMDPAKARASRFHRIERFDCKREWVAALLFGLFISIVFLLTGWTNQIASTYKALTNLDIWTHLFILALATGILWVLATVAVFILRFLLYGKIQIKQLSAGTASVTLDDNSVSYFDQYLDEIVYFFTVTDHNVVILEDIDRFNDSQIFETLRALNTLLNASPQVGKRIRFIYAIKDSIFDQDRLRQEGRPIKTRGSGAEDFVQLEATGASRTKFFDLIIPVVPFVAHHNARDLLKRLLGDDHGVDVALMDLAAKYIPDMRLLKNVCNEYTVFRNQLFTQGKKNSKPSEDKRAVQNTHNPLNLDKTKLLAMMLYKNTHLADFEKIRLGTSTLDKLYESSQKFAAQNIRSIENEIHRLELELEVSELKKEDWFRDFAEEQLSNMTRSLMKDITFLDGADMGELMQETKFPVAFQNNDHSSGNGISDNRKKTSESFDSTAKELLKCGLAYQLVRAGYIDRNFTLYSSKFYDERLSFDAMYFLIHHIRPARMNMDFKLTMEDVKSLVRECGEGALSNRGFYNVSTLDHLINSDATKASIMIRSLATMGATERQFSDAYLTHGKGKNQFFRQLLQDSSEVLIYLAEQTSLDDNVQRSLMNYTLENLGQSWQRSTSYVIDYLLEHYGEFSVLTADKPAILVEPVAGIFADWSVKLPSLEPLSADARNVFIKRNLYNITRENLTIIRGSGRSLALDAIQSRTKTIYDYMLRNLGDYLRAVDGFSCTVDKAEQFIPVLEDLLKQAENQSALEPSLIESVVERAAPECRVQNLADISDKVWQTLALHKRFPGTFNNVSRYVTIFGIDKNLASLLAKADEITEVESAEVDKKALLAKSIRTAQDHLPDASLRESLVASLKQSSPRDIEER